MGPSDIVDADVLDEAPGGVPPVFGEAPPRESPGTPRAPSPPVTLHELAAMITLVVVADLTVYRSQGFAGLAVFFVLSPALLWIASRRTHLDLGGFVVATMMVLVSFRLVWCGSPLLCGIGFALVVAFSMTLVGLRPYVLEAAAFASQAIPAGYAGLVTYWRTAGSSRRTAWGGSWLNVGLPAAALAVFSLLFVMANPDLLDFLGTRIGQFVSELSGWLRNLALRPTEAIFWIAVFWLGVGLIRPMVRETLLEEDAGAGQSKGTAPSPLYAAFRNTLVTVIALFAVYLAFEFSTLWFREFPVGFHYSGYAHEGAAWLTVALAVATALLSFVFRGSVLTDPRLSQLRKLAWVWSVENLALAVAVYHRMLIYVDFNGMTRMRTIGLFGISAVVIGFVLVLWKIARNRDFVWLVHRQLWALALTVYVFALTPVDTLVVSYNVKRILGGDPAPSVQISVHPINSEAVLLLRPLLDCDDPVIREGVRAILAERFEFYEHVAAGPNHWTAWQISDNLTRKGLERTRERWERYAHPAARESALSAFHQYAYQWY